MSPVGGFVVPQVSAPVTLTAAHAAAVAEHWPEVAP